MNRLSAVLSAVLIAAAVLAHRGSIPEPTPRRERPTAFVTAPAADPVVAPVAAAPVQGVPSVHPASPPAPSAPAPAFGSWALLGLLDRALHLSDVQMQRAEEILRERNRKVDQYGQEVARRGWAQVRDFEFRVGAIREEAIRRLAGILDAAQADELGRQAASGTLEDHLAIEIPDGVVLLD